FKQFETTELFPEGYQKEDQSTVPVAKGKNKEVEVAIKDAIHLPIKKGDEEKYELQYHIDKKQLNKDNKLTAPIKKGEKIGTAEIIVEGEKDYCYLQEGKDSHTVDLIATEAVDKKNWFMLILGAIG